MSQRTVNFLKNVDFQLVKNGGYSLTDERSVRCVQKLYNNGVDSGDTISGATMPISQLGVTLDWSAGAGYDDYIVKLTKGLYGVTQDLTASNLPVTQLIKVLTMNGGDTLGLGDAFQNMRAAVIYGNYIVFGGLLGEISSYNYVTDTWYTCFSGGGISNVDAFNSENAYALYSLSVYSGYLIAAGGTYNNGKVASFDGSNWKYPDGTGSGTGPYNNNTALGAEAYASISYDGDLIIAGYQGRVASWDGSNWKNYDGSGSGTGPYNNSTATGSMTIYDLIIYNSKLTLGADASRVASWDGSNWKNYDGSGSGTGPYNGGTVLNNGQIYKIGIYSTFLVVAGRGVGSWDGSNWRNKDGSGSGTGPYNNGSVVGDPDGIIITGLLSYSTYLVVLETSKVGSWDGSNWKNYDGSGTGVGPYSTSGVVTGNSWVLLECDGNMVLGGYTGSVGSWDGSNWKNYDGTGSGTGPYRQVITSEEDITCSAVYDNHLATGGSNSDIASYDYETSTWNAYNKVGTGIWGTYSTTELFLIKAAIVYGTYLVFGSDYSYVASWDGTAWKKASGGGTGTGPYNYGGALGSSTIYCMAVYNGKLIIAGYIGYVASWDGANWKNYDGSGSGTGPYNNGTAMGTSQINTMIVSGSNLIIAGNNGYVASFDGTNWKNYDGTGSGTGPYSNGTVIGGDNILTTAIYDGDVIFAGGLGKVGSWDGVNWKNYDGSGSGTGPYNNAVVLGNSSIYSTAVSENKLVFAGGSGRVGSWDGVNWKNYDASGSGTGPYNNGAVLGYRDILVLQALANGFYTIGADERIGCFDSTTWHNYNE